MSEELKKRKSRFAAVVVAAILLLAGYVGGYFAVSTKTHADDDLVIRKFGSRLVSTAYWPVGWCECKMRQISIVHTLPLGEDSNRATSIVVTEASTATFEP